MAWAGSVSWCLWNQIHLRHFDGIVINCGREVGKTLDDLIQVIETDSTYGSIHKFLHGYVGKATEIKVLDADKPILEIDGIPVKILRTARDPKDINWLNEGVAWWWIAPATLWIPILPRKATNPACAGIWRQGQ
jgi:hypothetical protein